MNSLHATKQDLECPSTLKTTYLLTSFLVGLVNGPQCLPDTDFGRTQTLSFQISGHHFTTVGRSYLKNKVQYF